MGSDKLKLDLEVPKLELGRKGTSLRILRWGCGVSFT